MNPPTDATKSAFPQDPGSPASADIEPETEASTTGVPMDQFIWEEAAGTNAADVAPEDEASLHIVVLSEDADGDSENWRRQLISALHDVDRETERARRLPNTPPPLPLVEAPRPPPRSLAPSRPARIATPAPIVRRSRHRTGVALLGVSAAAGLLSATWPHVANTPELITSTESPASLITGSLETTSAEGEIFTPTMFSTPVLIREGMSPIPGPMLPVGTMIETIRAVPIRLGTETPAPMSTATMPPLFEEPAIEETAALPPADQPPTADASPSLDRNGLTALAADPPAATPPAPVASKEEPASAPPRARTPQRQRTPQVSTPHQRTVRAAPRTTRPSVKKAERTSVARAPRQPEWETRRQGLRNPPPEEPNTMVKILKSLWPFSSESEAEAAAKAAQSSTRKLDERAPSQSKNSFWWGERDAQR